MNWNIFCKSTKSDFKFTFYDSVTSINAAHWNKATFSQNIYLSLDYLQGLEQAMKGVMEFRYILFYNKKLEPVAAAAVQLLNFSGASFKYRELLSRVGVNVKETLPKSMDVKAMICGNVFTCGENGFTYISAVSAEEAYAILAEGLEKLRKEEKANGDISVVLLKEFWPESFAHSDVLKKTSYRDFMIDVNMVLKLNTSWNTLDDYLSDMTTKFRTKAKSVFKKSEGIQVVDFTKEDIAKYKSKIEALHSNVIEKADFRLDALNGEAFLNFKKHLHKSFIIKGYFLKEELIGFSSAFVFNGVVDANYVGIDYSFNQEYALYQRMLYDFVELAILRNASELRLGRTAEEIKSCLGAEPTNMKLYIKHGNRISNKLLKPIIDSIAPADFELRKPFKQNMNIVGQRKVAQSF